MNCADSVKIEKTLAPACEFIDDDILFVHRHEVLWRRAEQSYASEIGEVCHVSRAAIDADEIVAQPHDQQSRFKVDFVDQRMNLKIELLLNVLKCLRLQVTSSDKNEVKFPEPVDLFDRINPLIVVLQLHMPPGPGMNEDSLSIPR